MDGSIEPEWEQLGYCRVYRGNLILPPGPALPGLYRFEFAAGRARTTEYIGETSSFASRFRHYARPGPRQATNIRVHDRIREVLSAGGEAGLSVALRVLARGKTGTRLVDLTDTNTRKAVEWMLLKAAIADLDVVENHRVHTLERNISLATIRTLPLPG